MNDFAILAMYSITALAICRADFLLCAVTFAICSLFINVSTDISTVYSFSAAGFAYILLSLTLARAQSFGAVVIALYYFAFAADSWINSDVETWIWHNHETIVTAVHAAFVLSFSLHCQAVVAACRRNISRICAMLLGNQKSNSSQRCKES